MHRYTRPTTLPRLGSRVRIPSPAPDFLLSKPGRSRCLDQKFPGSFPKDGAADFGQSVEIAGDREERVAGERPGLAGEGHCSISEQQFGFTDSAGIKDQLSWTRVPSGFLWRNFDLEVTHRHPACLATPPYVDQFAAIRQLPKEPFAAFWRHLVLKNGFKTLPANRHKKLLTHKTSNFMPTISRDRVPGTTLSAHISSRVEPSCPDAAWPGSAVRPEAGYSTPGAFRLRAGSSCRSS